MEQHFRNYQINFKVQEKNWANIIVGNWEKGKQKTKIFSETTPVD